MNHAYWVFWRVFGWAMLIGTVLGAFGGWGVIGLEYRGYNLVDYLKGILFYGFFGAIISFTVITLVSLPTAVVIAILYLTPLKRYRTMPFGIALIALVVFFVWWRSTTISLGNVYEVYAYWAILVIAVLAMFGSVHRVFVMVGAELSDRN